MLLRAIRASTHAEIGKQIGPRTVTILNATFSGTSTHSNPATTIEKPISPFTNRLFTVLSKNVPPPTTSAKRIAPSHTGGPTSTKTISSAGTTI